MFNFGKQKVVELKVVDEKKVNELQTQIKELTKTYASDRKILEAELQTRIDKATKDKEKENNELREKNAVLSKEVEILEKAFENMGFDVKDMKDILNKLVDAVVSKNEIKLVK